MNQLRQCLRHPIPEFFDPARYLDAAVSAHLHGYPALAMALIKLADLPAIREWTESLWGKGGPWTHPVFVDDTLPSVPEAERAAARMPSTGDKQALIAGRASLQVLRHPPRAWRDSQADVRDLSDRTALGQDQRFATRRPLGALAPTRLYHPAFPRRQGRTGEPGRRLRSVYLRPLLSDARRSRARRSEAE